MSTDLDIRHELEGFLASNEPIVEVLPHLRDYHARQIPQDFVLSILEQLRTSSKSEEDEDRILEVMDLVAGFCRSEDVVWDNPTQG
jgi:hypothetical protein